MPDCFGLGAYGWVRLLVEFHCYTASAVHEPAQCLFTGSTLISTCKCLSEKVGDTSDGPCFPPLAPSGIDSPALPVCPSSLLPIPSQAEIHESQYQSYTTSGSDLPNAMEWGPNPLVHGSREFSGQPAASNYHHPSLPSTTSYHHRPSRLNVMEAHMACLAG